VGRRLSEPHRQQIGDSNSEPLAGEAEGLQQFDWTLEAQMKRPMYIKCLHATHDIMLPMRQRSQETPPHVKRFTACPNIGTKYSSHPYVSSARAGSNPPARHAPKGLTKESYAKSKTPTKAISHTRLDVSDPAVVVPYLVVPMSSLLRIVQMAMPTPHSRMTSSSTMRKMTRFSCMLAAGACFLFRFIESLSFSTLLFGSSL